MYCVFRLWQINYYHTIEDDWCSECMCLVSKKAVKHKLEVCSKFKV